MEHLRLDDLQVGGFKIWQNTDLFCFGTDAVLLANFVNPKKKDKMLDIGTGNGIIPILISAKADYLSFTALEIQHECALLASKNVLYNNLNNKINVVEGDILDTSLFPPSSFTYITCNPPYKPMGTGIKNPESALSIARHEILCTLEDIVKRASQLLMSKGKFALVHKPERLAEIYYHMKINKIEPKRIQLVYPRQNEPPCLVLVEGVKDGGKDLKWLTPLIIYDENGNYTTNCKDLYEKQKEEKK